LNQLIKKTILLWWKQQTFDLNLLEHLGNCVWCWKKSDRKLKTLAIDYPEIFDFPKRMERKYRHIITNIKIGKTRKMFRGYKKVKDIFKLSKEPFEKWKPDLIIGQTDIEDCAEECGSVIMDSFIDEFFNGIEA